MGDLSKHFSRDEFICKCGLCNQDTVDVELVDLLEDLHKHFDIVYDKVYITINSGNRCAIYNATIQGSSPTSLHIKSKAADIMIWRVSFGRKVYINIKEIYTYLIKKYPDRYGVIEHKTFLHVDVRKNKYHKEIV